MALQPDAGKTIDRSTTAPFLLRLFWRQNRPLDPWEFSVAPPADTSGINDYSSLLPSSLRSQSVQIYTWPNCTLAELTALFTSVLPATVMPDPAVGTRVVFKLIFPDTRANMVDGGRGKWIDKPLGSVIVGGSRADLDQDFKDSLAGDAEKTLADARFVIGDYIACSIYPPGADGRVVTMPSYSSSRGPPPPRDGGYRSDAVSHRGNGYGGGYGRGGGGGGGGGYRGGYSGRGGGFGSAPPSGDWRRGERLPAGYENGPRGGGYGGRRGGRPY